MNNEINDLFVRIYADNGNIEMPCDNIAKIIAALFGADIKPFSRVVTDTIDCDVRKNKEYIENSDDFLFWRYFIEVAPRDENADFDEYLKSVRMILGILKSNSIKAVASCDFEDMLN